jgi:hypothetical protein
VRAGRSSCSFAVGAIADYYLPDYGAPRAGDTTSAAEHALRDMIADGVQAAALGGAGGADA